MKIEDIFEGIKVAIVYLFSMVFSFIGVIFAISIAKIILSTFFDIIS